MLERFLFPPDQQYAPISKLSGGEKRRLFLLRVLMGAPNVLILDEPTNDLDVQTLGVLEDYLEDFNGCVIVVSHDRYFLDRTVDTIFAFEEGGILRQYPGNYSIYMDYKKTEENAAKNSENLSTNINKSVTSNATTATIDKSDKSRKLSFKEKKEYEAMEAKIAKLEAEKETIEKTLYNNPSSDFTKVQKLTEKLAELTNAIDQATERWLELAERV
jgi:ATP-binding cassette subfamily F protein uup